MQWQSWADFWHMGGNAAFVWGSYGVWLALAAWELWQLRQQRSSTLRQLRRWFRATQGQASRRQDTDSRLHATPHAPVQSGTTHDAPEYPSPNTPRSHA